MDAAVSDIGANNAPDETVGSPLALPSNYQWPGEFGESADTIEFCAICGERAELTCSKCQSVFYCSRKHKKQRRRQHNLECFPFKIVNAILLPVNENQPRIIKVVCTMMPPKDGESGYDYARVKSYLGHPNHLGRGYVDPDSVLPGLYHDYSLAMIWRDTFMIDDSSVNQCVQHLTRGLAPHKWAGPIVILKQQGHVLQNTERHADADLSMLESIIPYFMKYGC